MKCLTDLVPRASYFRIGRVVKKDIYRYKKGKKPWERGWCLTEGDVNQETSLNVESAIQNDFESTSQSTLESSTFD